MMSSNRSAPRTAPNSLSGKSSQGKGSSSASDDLRRLRTGKRGRPPIDPTQEGLVERRRRQVRKAQRSYRSRKEEEAACRMNEVQALESRIEHMRQSFFELISHLTKAEICPHDLQRITRDFLSASQTVDDDGHTHHNKWYSRAGPNPSSPVFPPKIDTSYYAIEELPPVPATVPIDTPRTTTLAIPLDLPPPVPLPGNFAQRLYFSCIKRAHGLLTNPGADGTEVARVFQYSFHYSDVNTVISTLDSLLRTNPDYRTAYVYKLGGAGTHYGNRPAGVSFAQDVWLGQETPFKSSSNEEAWFDPRDIEGWLEENGLVIGGSQSFMYLSEFRSFEPCRRSVALCPEPMPSVFSSGDICQGAKILNVDRFLQELLSRGVCLGGAPGFRRLDVEAAFGLAISDDPTFVREP
ncbi:hypothetical protein FE257_007675 [Aspergillus nanangensis]|uniref:BZIP domain-containing protein n=1 Tax=Aspergillus nanangensis TaxID=2582783 RepID=A0AAD4CMJ5_ASPNN|nr:hypothetical protein FE257_007675 [Aspergillus nanangensis]